MRTVKQKTLPKQQSPMRGNINQGRYHHSRLFHLNISDRFSRTPQERNLKNNSLKRPGDKGFLPSIGNSRQAGRSKPIQTNNQRKIKPNQNLSVIEHRTNTNEIQSPVLQAHSHNNSIERSPERKLFDESGSYEGKS